MRKTKEFVAKVKNGKFFILFGILILFCILAVQKWYVLRMSPFPNRYYIDAPSDVFIGKSDNFYLIEEGKKKVTVIDGNRHVLHSITGGSESAAFYYAQNVCDDEQGNIYIADVVYANEGTRIKSERIIRFDKKGKKRKILFEYNYDTNKDMPFQYGNILSVCEAQNVLFVVQKLDSQLVINKIETVTGEISKTDLDVPYDVNALSYQPANQRIAFSTRQGDLYILDVETNTTQCIIKGTEEGLPWKVFLGEDAVYYSDLYHNTIYRLDYRLKNGKVISDDRGEPVISAQSVLYTVQCKGNQEIVATDYSSIYSMENGVTHVYDSFVKADQPRRVFLYLLLLVFAVGVGCCIYKILFRIWKKMSHNMTFQRVFLVILPSVIIVSVTSALILKYFIATQMDANMQDIILMANLIEQQIDLEEIDQIKYLNDYRQQSYNHVKEPLDQIIDQGYENGQYCYYTIYRLKENRINAIMDYEDTLTTNHPTYEIGEEGYTQAFLEKETVLKESEVSAYGSWSFVLIPILNTEGEVAVVLEVGKNLDEMIGKIHHLIWETIVTAVTTCVVFLMISMEVIFFASYMDKRKKYSEATSLYMPLRTLIFLCYLVDSMQDSFIAVTASRLYEPIFGIPKHMGAAFPISFEVLMAALLSCFGGKMVEKNGTKRNMLLGFSMQCAGFFVCALFGSYAALLIGKGMIGAGMGIVYVTANTLAAMETEEALSEAAFADVSMGVLSGASVGAGLGTIILSFAGYQVLYLFGGLILFLGIILSLKCKSGKPQKQKKGKKTGVVEFIKNKEIVTFFILLLIPFMISMSFREYFFPLYAEQYEIGEVTIGRIYLICGLTTLYIGPVLSKIILSKMGRKNAVVFASVSMCVMMGIFALVPGVVTAIFGVGVLSIIVSFAYTCQYSYFGGLKACKTFGEGNSMGVYSLFENTGQTLGPVLYGFALLLGNRNGIAIIAVVLGVLALLFLASNGKRENKKQGVN